jgi:heme exporter protein A
MSVLSTEPAQATSPPVLEARDLACRRGERVVFRHTNLVVSSGQVIWLRGNNGQGKTSLLRVLAGLAEPEAGSVWWSGRPAHDRTTRSMGLAPLYVAHTNALKDELTAHEALAFVANLGAHTPRADAQAVDAALDLVGVHRQRHARVRTLSQGQRRRVALARLVLAGRSPHNPVWLLDEPYDALDTQACDVLNGLLTTHAQQGGAVVLTSHQDLGQSAPQHQTVWMQASLPPTPTPPRTQGRGA